MTVFFFLSTLHSCVSLFFFPLEKKAMHLFTQSTHSRHAIDIDNRLSVHGKKKKLNRCVFLFIHSKHGFVYKMRSSYFHFIERKEKRFMNQHRDWWKWSETVLAFFQLNEEWLYFGWRTLIWLWLSTIGSPYFDFFKWFSSCKYSHVNSINIFKDHLRIH